MGHNVFIWPKRDTRRRKEVRPSPYSRLPGLGLTNREIIRSSDDLWKAAVGTLSEDMRRIIDVNPGDKRSVLETVLFEAKRQRQLCLRKQWKITKRNGDVLILRDVFEKIITWVDKFKKVGDVAIQAAPSYAAIPWQVVGFLLKVWLPRRVRWVFRS